MSRQAAWISKRRSQARQAGVCITCFKERPREGRRVCRPCTEGARNRVLRHRAILRERAKLQHIIQAHEEAGDISQEHHLYDDAARHYQHALNVRVIASEDRLRISEKLSTTFFLGRNPSAPNPSLDYTVIPHLPSATEKIQIFGLMDQKIRQMAVAFKTQEASPVIAEMIRVAETIGDSYFIKKANLGMVNYLGRLDRFSDAEHYLQNVGEVNNDDDVALYVTYHMHKAMIASAFGKAKETYEGFERAVHATKNDTDLYRVTAVWHNYSLCAMKLGNTNLAKTCTERALLIARQNQIIWRIPHLCASYADLLSRIGQHEMAYDYLLNALSYDVQAPILDCLLAEVGIPLAVRMNDESTLKKCMRPSTIRMAFLSGVPANIGPVATAFAQFYATHNNISKARKLLHRALQVVHYVDSSWDLPLEIARRGALADVPQARNLLETRTQLPFSDVASAHLSLFDAFIAQRCQQFELSELHAVDAASRFDSLRWHAYADTARSLLSPDIPSVHPAISEHGGAFAEAHSTLTPRERQVAELVLKGLTNREIAEKLSITKYTVDSHLASIMNRLGIRSRYQLDSALPQTQ